jgi:phosphoserine aminotransferase
MLYSYIDSSKFYQNIIPKKNRSQMNVVFQLYDYKLTNTFFDYTEKNNIYGLKGHRSSGGFRASLYNAVSLRDIEILISVMSNFERYV